MEPQQPGADFRKDDEHITNLLLFGFLQNCAHHRFHEELEALQVELPGPRLVPQGLVVKAQDMDLQTDGNRCSLLLLEGEWADSESQEEIIHDIARQLAHIGDSLDHEIHPALVQELAARFMNGNLSNEERRKCLEAALGKILQACPTDMEQEKFTLLMTMLLVKKVADHAPALLRDVFRTTVNLIVSRNLLSGVRNLFRSDTD